MTVITHKQSFTVGRFIKRSFRKEMEGMCFKLNIKLEMKELKGIFESEFLATLEGDQRSIDTLLGVLKRVENKEGKK